MFTKSPAANITRNPSSVYEEPSSQYYEEPSSDDYGYNYEDSSTYTDSAITGSLLPETSADGASGTTSHNWDKLLENINSANAAGMEDAPSYLRMILTIPITQAPTMAAGSFGQESALSFWLFAVSAM